MGRHYSPFIFAAVSRPELALKTSLLHVLILQVAAQCSKSLTLYCDPDFDLKELELMRVLSSHICSTLLLTFILYKISNIYKNREKYNELCTHHSA